MRWTTPPAVVILALSVLVAPRAGHVRWTTAVLHASQGGAARSPDTAAGTIAIDTNQYKLITTGTRFLLASISDRSRQPIPIPRGWLVPSEEEAAEAGANVSSFNYAEKVTSFEVGDGRVGLQISSYDVQQGGSAQAAAGRDVFLVLDPRRGRLYDPGLRLGITRHRVRALGCFEASQSNFLLSDVNGDERVDLGAIREELVCKPVVRDGVDTIDGPRHVSHPVRWYVFAGDGWKLDERLEGRLPTGNHVELPAAGKPIDFLKTIVRLP